ncbi:MAG: hypothetical protein ACOCX7_03165 [Bacteroidota bacterium]
MKRSILLMMIALLIIPGLSAIAQKDGRNIPYYMQPDFIYSDYYSGFNGPKINKIVPTGTPGKEKKYDSPKHGWQSIRQIRRI